MKSIFFVGMGVNTLSPLGTQLNTIIIKLWNMIYLYLHNMMTCLLSVRTCWQKFFWGPQPLTIYQNPVILRINVPQNRLIIFVENRERLNYFIKIHFWWSSTYDGSEVSGGAALAAGAEELVFDSDMVSTGVKRTNERTLLL